MAKFSPGTSNSKELFFLGGSNFPHCTKVADLSPKKHFRKESARDGTENGSKYWWLQGFGGFDSVACVRVDCLPWGNAGIASVSPSQRGNPLFQGHSRGQNTQDPYEQWKNPWLFRVYRGSQDLVIWWLFHKPWNKDPYSATSIMESKTVFFRTHTN